MTGDGARRGTLVIHYVADDQRPPLDRGSPETLDSDAVEGSCGSQPAHQSLLDRRLQRRPLPCANFGQPLCYRADREANAHASLPGNGT